MGKRYDDLCISVDLKAEVDEYHCPDPVTGYDCKAINALKKRVAKLGAKVTLLNEKVNT